MTDEAHGSTARTPWVGRVVNTSVGPLATWHRGSGDAVVLRHGIFFDHDMWMPTADALAAHHRVVLIDSPGHGRSADAGHRYTLEDDARATLEVMDALGIEAATLVGHSWGGMSAVRAALSAPARVHALGLIDVPLEAPPVSGRLRYRMLRLLVRAIGTPGWYGGQVAKAMFSTDSRARDPRLTEVLKARLTRLRRAPLGRAMDAVLVRPDDISHRLGELAQPILVLAGDEDYVLPASTRAALAARTPQAEVDTLPGMHVLPLEQPGATIARLEAFLARVPA